jgi:uncharacterized protein YecE (DUF72 family)
MPTLGKIYVGLSGYSYKPWQGAGRFYPETLKATQFLSYYATRYDAVELDGLWYRLPSEEAVRAWIEQTPEKFLFAPKAHRQITHMRRLKPEAIESARVMLERLSPLGDSGRLGPILLQLPPNLRRDDERLKNFLSQVPAHCRWAVEFRHASWNVPEVETLLRLFGVAWVAAETDDTPAERRHTANFCYTRLRRSGYDEDALAEWAQWFTGAAASGRDCFIFFKHEDDGAPWRFADRLLELVAVPKE